MEGDSSRTALISAAGTSAKTSWTVVEVSAQNWSQNASSVASTGCKTKKEEEENKATCAFGRQPYYVSQRERFEERNTILPD